MNKCIKISLIVNDLEDALQEVVQKHAKKLNIEGTVQVHQEGNIKIVACGAKDDVDTFLDMFHKSIAEYEIDDLEIIPFIKDKDYRGVFRVIA